MCSAVSYKFRANFGLMAISDFTSMFSVLLDFEIRARLTCNLERLAVIRRPYVRDLVVQITLMPNQHNFASSLFDEEVELPLIH